MQQEGAGGLPPGLAFDRKAEAVSIRHPFARAQEDLALILALGDEDAIESDIIDDDAVRQVLHGEGDEVVVAVAFDPKERGDGLTRGNGQLCWDR